MSVASFHAALSPAASSGAALAGALSGLDGAPDQPADRTMIAEAVLAGAWRTLRAAGFREAEVQALFDQIADRPEDLARRLRKMANAAG